MECHGTLDLEDTTSLKTNNHNASALSGQDANKGGNEDAPLYICWISQLKRAGSSKLVTEMNA